MFTSATATKPRNNSTTKPQHTCQHFVLLIASSTFGMPIFYFLCFWLPPAGFWLPPPDPPPFGFGLAALPVAGVPWTTSSSDSVVVLPECSPPLERVCTLGVSCLANATLLASVGAPPPARRFGAAGGTVDAAAATKHVVYSTLVMFIARVSQLCRRYVVGGMA